MQNSAAARADRHCMLKVWLNLRTGDLRKYVVRVPRAITPSRLLLLLAAHGDCLGPSGIGRLDRPGWSGANAPKTVFPTLGEA